MAYPLTYPPNTAFVTGQPKQYDIHSNFGMFAGERLLYHSKMKSGCCKLGDTYHTSVTDTRYVARTEHWVCCDCCFKRPHSDSCIYLNDISELHEVRDAICCENRCSTFFCHLCTCLYCCRCLVHKRLQLCGSFGSHTVHIDGKDIADFELMFTEVIGQHKLPH